MEQLGVKSLFGKSQPGRTLQRGLTYTLILRGIWAQCIVIQGYMFLSADPYIISPTWNKSSSELFTHSLTELVSSAQARGFLRVVTRTPISSFEVREHLGL